MTPLQANQDLKTTWEHTLSALRVSPPTETMHGSHPGVAFGRAAFAKACHAIVVSARDRSEQSTPSEMSAKLGAALATRYDLTELLNIGACTKPLRHAAWTEALRGPRAQALRGGLLQTHAIAREAKACGLKGPWSETKALHPTGVAHASHDERCGSCAWAIRTDGHTIRCRQQTPGAQQPTQLHEGTAACYRHEKRLTASDCLGCGACCRGGFDRVAVEADSPLQKQNQSWIVREKEGAFLPRPGGLCVALAPTSNNTWPCTVYPQRPRSCRDFEVGGDACLLARRRTGTSHD